VLTVPKSNAPDDRESTAVAVDLSVYEFVTTPEDGRSHFVFRDAGVELRLASQKLGLPPVDPKDKIGNSSPELSGPLNLQTCIVGATLTIVETFPHSYLVGNSVLDRRFITDQRRTT
jgi:hypothetical protein